MTPNPLDHPALRRRALAAWLNVQAESLEEARQSCLEMGWPVPVVTKTMAPNVRTWARMLHVPSDDRQP
jgi:hypothetical protein